MSLPDVQFSNNLGNTFFKQCLIGVTDGWEYNGRVARHVKSISIDGFIKAGDATQTLDNLITNRSVDGERYGSDGTLTLPWTTLSNIRMTELNTPTNIHLDWVPVQVAFADDFPDSNLYTMTFFGNKLYNPRLTIPLPNRQLKDQYPQMPWSDFGVAIQDPRNGVFRNRAGQRNMDIGLTGSMRIDEMRLPINLLATLTGRNGLIPQLQQNYSIPVGYPRPFNLGDAIPEISADMNLAHVIITRAVITWQVEQHSAQLNVQMLCPPQMVGR